MFHPTVVLKEADIVDRGLNPQDPPVLVIHLDGGLAHVMLDAGSLDAGLKIIAQLVAILAAEFAAQKAGHIIGAQVGTRT